MQNLFCNQALRPRLNQNGMDTVWNICFAAFVGLTWLRAARRSDRSTSGGRVFGNKSESTIASDEKNPPAQLAETALKILAVDDEPSIAAYLSFIFKRPRYELTSARNGNDALARVSAAPVPYDVIITDNDMPHLSGVGLVRALRERSFGGKIMVLSGDLTAEAREAYSRMKVDAILDKPFDNQELRNRLDLLVA
jgi:CheY-like chemotaxis protein